MPDRGFCETKARPHVALNVIDPALRLSLGLGLVRTVQPHLESHPAGTHSASTGSIPPGHPRPAQSHRPGVVVETAAGPDAEMLEGFGVALDESGGVCTAHQFRVAGPGPTQDHREGPDAALPTVFAQIGQTAPSPPCARSREPSRRTSQSGVGGDAGAPERSPSESSSPRRIAVSAFLAAAPCRSTDYPRGGGNEFGVRVQLRPVPAPQL